MLRRMNECREEGQVVCAGVAGPAGQDLRQGSSAAGIRCACSGWLGRQGYAGFGQPSNRLGDTFADCFVAVDQAARFYQALPRHEQVVGIALPYTIELGVDGVPD